MTRTHRTKTIRTLQGVEIASAGFIAGPTWPWISETVAQECECDAKQVGMLETDEGDVLTVDGLPVFLLC